MRRSRGRALRHLRLRLGDDDAEHGRRARVGATQDVETIFRRAHDQRLLAPLEIEKLALDIADIVTCPRCANSAVIAAIRRTKHYGTKVHCGLMPTNFTTLLHFSVSSAMNLPKSAGERNARNEGN
jgi:hypothetical protein